MALSIEHIGPIPETIETDPLRFRQILANLIGNAIKFTISGGVHIAAELLHDDSNRLQLRIDVSDTGIGIMPDAIHSLFERFSQADSSTTRRFGGSGLGLAISKRLATLLGGDVAVQSELGRGSTFTVTIDVGSLENVRLVENPHVGPIQERPMQKSRKIASGERILLAEDCTDNQRIITLILTNAGFQVTTAENGQLACEKALAAMQEGKPFDMILMDMQMPVMEGYEATQRLRAAGYVRPIVALTAHATVGRPAKMPRCRPAIST